MLQRGVRLAGARRRRRRDRGARGRACARPVARPGAREPDLAVRPRAATSRRPKSTTGPRWLSAANLSEAHYDYGVLLGMQEKWDRGRRRLSARARAESASRAGAQQSRPDARAPAPVRGGGRRVPRRRSRAQPTFRLARFNLGRMLLALGRNEEAIAELAKLSQPQDSETPTLPVRALGRVRAGRAQGRRHQVGDRGQAPGARVRTAGSRRDHRARSGETEMTTARQPCCRLLPSPSACWPRWVVLARRAVAGRRPRRSSSRRPPPTGLAFTHVSGASGQYYMAEQMGAGVALFDYDSDGDLDVFLVQGGPLEPGGKIGPAHPTSRLFRNDLKVAADGGRTLHFTDVTDDGRRRPARLRHGRGGRRLRQRRRSRSLRDRPSVPRRSTATTATARSPTSPKQARRERPAVERERRVRRLRPRRRSRSLRRQLPRLHARRQQAVQRRRRRARLLQPARVSAGARPAVPQRGRRPVHRRRPRPPASARPTAPAWAYRPATTTATAGSISTSPTTRRRTSSGSISATARSWTRGCCRASALNAAGNPEGSMGIASGDFDLDGDEDLFVTNIVGETFAMYVNDGRGSFDDARARVGLAAPTAAFTGFGTDWFDYDNDGWLDLFVANGAVNIVEAQRGREVPVPDAEPAVSQHRCRPVRGRRARPAGPAFDRAEIGRGAAFGDIDNDGDIDVVVDQQQRTGEAAPQSGPAGRTTGCRCACSRPQGNRFGFGARIGVERAGRPTVWRRVRTDGSYLSASDARVHVGLGDVGRGGGRRRRMARRRARTLDGRRGGPRRHAAARDGKIRTLLVQGFTRSSRFGSEGSQGSLLRRWEHPLQFVR